MKKKKKIDRFVPFKRRRSFQLPCLRISKRARSNRAIKGTFKTASVHGKVRYIKNVYNGQNTHH